MNPEWLFQVGDVVYFWKGRCQWEAGYFIIVSHRIEGSSHFPIYELIPADYLPVGQYERWKFFKAGLRLGRGRSTIERACTFVCGDFYSNYFKSSTPPPPIRPWWVTDPVVFHGL